jgi:hypothetical protein
LFSGDIQSVVVDIHRLYFFIIKNVESAVVQNAAIRGVQTEMNFLFGVVCLLDFVLGNIVYSPK